MPRRAVALSRLVIPNAVRDAFIDSRIAVRWFKPLSDDKERFKNGVSQYMPQLPPRPHALRHELCSSPRLCASAVENFHAPK